MNILTSPAPICHATAQPRSVIFQIRVNGIKVDALHAEKADFAAFECKGPADIRISTGNRLNIDAQVRPLSRKISADLSDGVIRIHIDGPQSLCLDIPGLKPFFIYANPPEADKPLPDAPGVHYYSAGLIHEAGEIVLKSGETLYIEEGAVVRGVVRSVNSKNIAIRGHGILDGRCHSFARGDRVRSVMLDHCEDVSISGIIMIEPTSWMLVLGNCRDVHVNNLKQIGSCISSDGIDICGSSNVLIENCCLRNDDDNIAIKAGALGGLHEWTNNVEHVRVRRCVFFNGVPGNAMEIGYELSAGRVHDVVFEDIDVINAQGEGAVFSIHNGDRAVVENIRWENIRVEHYWDKLVDFRIVCSRYNRDTERGTIRRVMLRNIHVVRSIYNPGCSVSLIGGVFPLNPVSDVCFDGFYLNGERARSGDDLELHTRHAEDIRFL